jgi:hypothetical protein
MMPGARSYSLRGRIRGFGLAWIATISLIVATGAGAAGIRTCAHHAHSPEVSDGASGHLETHAGTSHESPAPHEQDGDSRCDCLGSCTLSAGPPTEREIIPVTAGPHIRSEDTPVAESTLRVTSLTWLYPQPNAPPSL